MASFIITNGTDSPPIIGANLVPGPIKEGDSLRCELAGLYGIVHMIEHISCHYKISKGSVHVACNNEQALKVFHPNFLPDPQQANFDFQNALFALLKESPISWLCEHVKGHQDTKQRHRPLTCLESLIVCMDKLAQKVWSHYALHPHALSHAPCSIDGEGWQLWNGDQKVSSPSDSTVYSILQYSSTQTWWI